MLRVRRQLTSCRLQVFGDRRNSPSKAGPYRVREQSQSPTSKSSRRTISPPCRFRSCAAAHSPPAMTPAHRELSSSANPWRAASSELRTPSACASIWARLKNQKYRKSLESSATYTPSASPRKPTTTYTSRFAQVYFPVIAFTVRTKGAPESIIPQAKAAIWKIDPQQPFFKVITVDELASESIALRRSSMLLLGAFSAIALALAIVGIYGVLSYSVAQRTREIGVRTAMGASSGDVLRLIFKDGVRLIVPGVAAGLAISILLARTVSSLLVGVAPTDLSTFAGTTVLVVTSALAACYLPARRAAAVDPINALRYE